MATDNIEFVGGIRDGEVFAYPSPIPPEVHFPVLVDYPFPQKSNYDLSASLPIRICRYRRLADTHTYVCLDWYKT